MEVWIDNQKVKLGKSLGVGGEAQVFLWQGMAVKVFHAVDPSATSKQKQIWQRCHDLKLVKLQNFPTDLPANVITPQKLVYNRQGQIVGYAMACLSDVEVLYMLCDIPFRRAGFPFSSIIEIFIDLWKTLESLHKNRVIVGDFNPLNILFKNLQTYLIDADSLQFKNFPCPVFTERYVDPRLFNKDFLSGSVYTSESDYYSFAVMLFESLLMLHPFDGVHLKYPNMIRRIQDRISVFNSAVIYPKKAIPYKVLPDELLQYFEKVFEKDFRGLLPLNYLQNMRWTKCSDCGLTHARAVCPVCIGAVPTKQVIMAKGNCISSSIFKTRGRIVSVKMQGGKLKYIYEENNILYRETGEKVLNEKANYQMRFSFMGDTTLIGFKDKVALIKNEKVQKVISVGKLGNWPVFDSNEVNFFALSGDNLAQDDQRVIGQILEDQTWFKVGSTFGFGFYRVGLKTVYFTFDVNGRAINDSVGIPSIKGKLLDAECVFSDDYALFTVSEIVSGKVINSMYLIRKNGTIKAQVQVEADNSRMLKNIHGKVIGGANILSATDEGLVLIVPDNRILTEVKLFVDTEPFVAETSQIFTIGNSIYVVSEKEIISLRLA